MSDPQALNLDEADGFAIPLCMLGAHGFKVAGYPQIAEVFEAAVTNDDARRYVLALVFKPNAVLGEAPQAIAGLAGLGQLVEILALVRQYLPLVKEYLPTILAAIKTFKEIADVLKGIKPSVPTGGSVDAGGLPPRKPNF